MGTNAPLSDISADALVDFDTEVMMLPQFDPMHPEMISQGPSVCVFNKPDSQEVLASWLFAQYLLTNDVQIAYAETEGYVPVTSKAQQDAAYQDYLAHCGIDDDTHYGVKIQASELLLYNAENTFVTPVFNGSASLRDASGQLIENVVKSVRRKETIDFSDKYGIMALFLNKKLTKRGEIMRKSLIVTLALSLTLALAGCGKAANDGADVKGEGVMTYADYVAADVDSEVVVETYVQAKQGWWENEGVGVATFYTQDKDGAYFLYNMPCSKEDYDKLTEGTKIKVTGYKSEWAGEVEIIDATYEIEDGSYVAEAADQTSERACSFQGYDRRGCQR